MMNPSFVFQIGGFHFIYIVKSIIKKKNNGCNCISAHTGMTNPDDLGGHDAVLKMTHTHPEKQSADVLFMCCVLSTTFWESNVILAPLTVWWLYSPSKHSKPPAQRAHARTHTHTYAQIYLYAWSMQLPECVSGWWQCHHGSWGILAPAGVADMAALP